MSFPTADDPQAFIWSIILAIGIITFGLRFIPLALLSRIHLPASLRRALVYVPPAVMAAIITPALFFPGGTPNMTFDAPRLLAALVAGLIAWKTRSVLWTVTLGMCSLWVMQAFMR